VFKKETETIQLKCNWEEESNLVPQYSVLLSNKPTSIEYAKKQVYILHQYK